MATEIETAIALRGSGRAEEARELLLSLLGGGAEDAMLQYQLAWTHDVLGREREAVPYYERALALGLDGEERAGALLGLGSTYRALGEYERAAAVLREAVAEYPGRQEFRAFLAMALHNLGEHSEAMELLLQLVAQTSEDPGIRSYHKAILFYSDKLDEVWE
ncbi:tetratricopeptide repeat protein [Paenibacillus tepidiphilus]|uniref:tetratricopeptide repeat protein n=1 Tax=Paenibacillus tepidiphilus TaxID=2608683 RepID=UPI00123A8554|nr:tetratricopeptide repeat protein [Paenibacillus tepidiphilus]